MADKIDLSSSTNLVVKGAGTNLDNERTPGIFAADTPSNAPDSGVVVVEVSTIVVNGVRTTLQNAVVVLTGAVAIRYRKVDGTWTGWVSPTGTTNLSYTASPTNGVVVSDTGGDATLTLADATNAGLMSPAGFSKLAGIAAGAEVNLTGAALLSVIDTAAGSDFWRTAPRVQIDVVTSSGTYNIPTWAVRLDATAIGGGGGGGGARRGATGSARASGAGGGAGGVVNDTFIVANLTGSTISVVVGAGGTAGTAATADDTNGGTGGTGGTSTLTNNSDVLLSAIGGSGGTGGGTATGAGGVGGTSNFGQTNTGGAGSATVFGGAGVSSLFARGPGGGAGGGGITTGNTRLGPGAGGGGYSIGDTGRKAAGGAGGPLQGNPGSAGSAKAWQCGAGGGGGGGNSGGTTGTGAGGDGGAGGAPGGGGGGGGATTNGSVNSGAGGVGGAGEVWIIAIA